MTINPRAAVVASVVTLLLSACAPSPTLPGKAAVAPRTHYDSAFWDTWGDGFAEVSTYQLLMPRYGEPREGESIMMFVSETLSERQRVKSDPGRNPRTDEFSAMKLNWQKNFQTGIYDYSEMLSSFLGLAPIAGRPEGSLAKASFSRQEWCGHMFAQALFDSSRIRVSGASYFDGDADLTQSLTTQSNGISEDGLAFWARRMAPPFLKPGESKDVPFLTGLRSARDAHQPMVWTRINLTRNATLQHVEVPAGEFEVEAYSAQLANGRGFVYFVEREEPYRIIRWQFTSGEVAELVASERIKYWELNRPGGEEALRSLGLEPRAPRFSPED
jgi:hypothetical protein